MKLSERLKQETQEAHRNAEKEMPFLRTDFGRDQYIAMIERLFYFYSNFERSLGLHLKDSPLNERLNKTRLLEDTLKEWEVIANSSSKSINVDIENFEQAIGAMYVIEGSTLGGQIIAKNFSDRLGLSESQTQFFRGYGPQTGLMWQKFKAFLDSEELQSLNQQEIIKGANQTFQRITNVMRA